MDKNLFAAAEVIRAICAVLPAAELSADACMIMYLFE